MKLIICPTDFSPNATNAARYAAALANQFNARIILLHVYEVPLMFAEMPIAGIKDAEKQIKNVAEEKLSALKSTLSKKYRNVTFESRLAEGISYDEIVSLASKVTADLIVIGSTGTSKLTRMLMGSTTSRVIRDAHCPVLSVPKDASFQGIHKIIFATDLQMDNINSAMTISSFAQKFDAEIIFVFVDDKHLLHPEIQINKMTAKIRKHVKYPRLSGYISNNPDILKGITQFLKKFPGDMLVMFSHPRHFPDSMFTASVTRMMSYQTHLPLLSLKHEDRSLSL